MDKTLFIGLCAITLFGIICVAAAVLGIEIEEFSFGGVKLKFKVLSKRALTRFGIVLVLIGAIPLLSYFLYNYLAQQEVSPENNHIEDSASEDDKAQMVLDSLSSKLNLLAKGYRQEFLRKEITAYFVLGDSILSYKTQDGIPVKYDYQEYLNILDRIEHGDRFELDIKEVQPNAEGRNYKILHTTNE